MTRIFISYRRQDTTQIAGKLFDRLAERFGRDSVFMDIDAIPPGVDFVEVLTKQIAACKVMLAVIGSNWLTASDNAGKRRLDNRNDFVRLEIEAALRRNIPVLPVLVGSAPMPRPDELPESLRSLTRHLAAAIDTDRHFDAQMERLIGELRHHVDGRTPLERMKDVTEAQTEEMRELLKTAGLDPSKHLRFQDWSGSSFRSNDLRGFDFTGARLLSCDFHNALIAGARFDQCEIDRVGLVPQQRTDLRAAEDWMAHVSGWTRSSSPMPDSHLGVGSIFQDAPFAPEMVIIPAGRFLMGAASGDDETQGNESPQHEVTIARPFAVGRYPVTFEEWDFAVAHGGCVDRHPNDEGWGRGRRPVINVSWKDVQAYVAWLRETTAKEYRLLSEAEWEYAARAGTTTRCSFGNADSGGDARYRDKFSVRTFHVGALQPNPWGLHDMHGNVWEWVEDIFHNSYDGVPTDGGAWVTNGDKSLHIIRGGSWNSDDDTQIRSAYRSWAETDTRGDTIGFRVARNL
jgi:formylglycine-generating enzyme required for sulfatase activity